MDVGLVEVIAHLPVFVRRFRGEIVHWTPGCQELFGYDAAEAVGALAHELLKTELPEPPEAIARKLQARGQWSGRVRHTNKSGRELWVEAVWRLRESDNPGGPIVVEQNTDITERVALEEKTALLARELEHRVKNILNVVQALARMTFPDAPKAQLQDLFLGAAARQNERMTLFLVNGVMLQGLVTAFDQFCVLLERGGQLQLVYKHALSTLQPEQALNLGRDGEQEDE